MRVFLNSDITFHPELVRGQLTRRLSDLASACRDHGHVLVLPRTTILEFRRQQELARTRMKAQLQSALELLDEFGVHHENVVVDDAVSLVGLDEWFRPSGVRVEVHEPTAEDLLRAHDKACLHAPPMKPDSKSDEMRDLVIWEMAIRSACEAPTLLVSADEVHVGDLGEAEAAQCGLLRARSIEDALDVLQVSTPARQTLTDLFTAVWEDLRAAGLPIDAEVSLGRVQEPRFVQGSVGLSEVSALTSLPTATGDQLQAYVRFKIDGARIVGVSVSSIGTSPVKADVNVATDKPWAVEPPDMEERRRGLREVLES